MTTANDTRNLITKCSVAFACLEKKHLNNGALIFFLQLKYNLNQNFSSVDVLALVATMIQIYSSEISRQLANLLILMEEEMLKILSSGPMKCLQSTQIAREVIISLAKERYQLNIDYRRTRKKITISDQYNFLQSDTQTMSIQISAILEFGLCRKTQRYMCTPGTCNPDPTPTTSPPCGCSYDECLCKVLEVTPIFLFCRILYLLCII